MNLKQKLRKIFFSEGFPEFVYLKLVTPNLFRGLLLYVEILKQVEDDWIQLFYSKSASSNSSSISNCTLIASLRAFSAKSSPSDA